MTSCHQVFQIQELFQAILLNLDVKDLLEYQAVSPQWRQTIKTSSPVQRKLFLRPVSTLAQLKQICHSGDDLRRAKYKYWGKQYWPNRVLDVSWDGASRPMQTLLGDIVINPFFDSTYVHVTDKDATILTVRLMPPSDDGYTPLSKENARVDMFLTQPPYVSVVLQGIGFMVLDSKWMCKRLDRFKSVVENPEGVTMRNLLDEMERINGTPDFKIEEAFSGGEIFEYLMVVLVDKARGAAEVG